MYAISPIVLSGCVGAAFFGYLLSRVFIVWHREKKRRHLLRDQMASEGPARPDLVSKGMVRSALLLLINESVRSQGDASASDHVRTWAGGNKVDRLVELSGLRGRVCLAGLWRTRLTTVILSASMLGMMGAFLSLPLAFAGIVSGAFAGWAFVPRALRMEAMLRSQSLERHLSQALEVICLGLRSGLSFDYSLQLYCDCFDGVLARELSLARREWQAGLRSREEVLRDVSSTYDSSIFSRVVDNIVRSTRFGSPLAENLEMLAAEARKSHRASVEERVMKAPVKMMLPVGMLILPSMLILVLGPVLLDLMERF